MVKNKGQHAAIIKIEVHYLLVQSTVNFCKKKRLS